MPPTPEIFEIFAAFKTKPTVTCMSLAAAKSALACHKRVAR